MSGDREERQRQFYERVIKKVEPTGKGDPARVSMYIDLFEREFVEDTRTFAFDVTAQADASGNVILKGFVEFPEHKDALVSLLKQLSVTNVTDEIELLPSPSLGEKKYGFVTAPRAFVYDRTTTPRETFTECLQGDVLHLLKETADGNLLVHAPDGYVGYIASDAVRRVDEAQLGAIEAAVPIRREADIDHAIAEAKKLLGTPYVWGASTKEGCDCSGLVGLAYRSVKVNLPRDADQQALVGRLVGTRWHRSGLRKGDTLFFISRRGTITHTALYLGDGKFIEATSPVVKITSFNPTDPDYNERRDKTFCFAKRVLE